MAFVVIIYRDLNRLIQAISVFEGVSLIARRRITLLVAHFMAYYRHVKFSLHNFLFLVSSHINQISGKAFAESARR